MKSKYIHFSDVEVEIEKSLNLINSLNEEIKYEQKRLIYLKVLLDYLLNDGLCPFTKKKLLDNNIELQHFAMPILYYLDKNVRAKYYKFNYNVGKDTIGKILTDFIDYVCDRKGHKVGIGQALIIDFLTDKVI